MILAGIWFWWRRPNVLEVDIVTVSARHGNPAWEDRWQRPGRPTLKLAQPPLLMWGFVLSKLKGECFLVLKYRAKVWFWGGEPENKGRGREVTALWCGETRWLSSNTLPKFKDLMERKECDFHVIPPPPRKKLCIFRESKITKIHPWQAVTP